MKSGGFICSVSPLNPTNLPSQSYQTTSSLHFRPFFLSFSSFSFADDFLLLRRRFSSRERCPSPLSLCRLDDPPRLFLDVEVDDEEVDDEELESDADASDMSESDVETLLRRLLFFLG